MATRLPYVELIRRRVYSGNHGARGGVGGRTTRRKERGGGGDPSPRVYLSALPSSVYFSILLPFRWVESAYFRESTTRWVVSGVEKRKIERKERARAGDIYYLSSYLLTQIGNSRKKEPVIDRKGR